MSASGLWVPAVTIDGAQTIQGIKSFSYNSDTVFNRPDSSHTKATLRDNGTIRCYVGATAAKPLSWYNAAFSAALEWDGATTLTLSTDTVATRAATETFTGQKTFYGAWAIILDRSDSGATKIAFRNASVNAGFVGCSATKPMIWYDAPATSTLEWNGGSQFLVVGKAVLGHAGAFTSGQVTLSTSAPSGGSDGDIWLQYV